MPLWFYNLSAYCAQLALLVLAGGLMAWATGLRVPRVRLIYWQGVLVLGLLLPVLQPWRSAPIAEPAAVPPIESVGAAANVQIAALPDTPLHTFQPISIYQVIALILAAGLLFRLIWFAVGLMRLRRSRRVARPLGEHAAAEELKRALGVSPSVMVSERLPAPVTFGWRKAWVLLPERFVHTAAGRQRAILCHEFLHVHRRDWGWHIAEEILRAVFWFHYAIAWLIAQIRLSREQLVDQEVVGLTGSRREYLDALLEAAAAGRLEGSPAPPFLGERNLKRRVALILKEASMSRKKLALALTASFGVIFISGAMAVVLLPLRTSAATAAPNVKPPLTEPETHFYGNPDAGLTIVEFGDFQCPFCGQAEAAIKEAREKFGGQVRFAYRQFPLTKIHVHAEKAAEASECAARQDKFWPAVNYFYEHQSDLSVPALEKYAAQLGLNQRKFDACLSTGKEAAQVRRDIQDGHAAGVSSVPTFFIGHKKVVGSLSYAQLRSLIEQQLHGEHAGDLQQPASAMQPTSAFPATPNEQPDEILYKKSLTELGRGQYAAGRLMLQTLINTYPKSDYLAKAKLAMANAYPTEDSRYAQWVNGPVRYIMTGHERADFEKLSSDSQRSRFVADFWAHHNPDPGSAGNSFRTEFYRRIAFANAHFSAGIPGWMTDRGEIYIRYGPPDRIETHSIGPKSLYPYQVWIYGYFPGVGHNVSVTFIDKTGTGDYKLAPGKATAPTPAAHPNASSASMSPTAADPPQPNSATVRPAAREASSQTDQPAHTIMRPSPKTTNPQTMFIASAAT